jgi:alcohol dehydrogenase
MVRPWNYFNPTRLEFGEEYLSRIGEHVDRLVGGGTVCLVTGRTAARKFGYLDRLTSLIGEKRVQLFEAVEAEPSQDTADRARLFVENSAARLVIALGGGSVLDVAKIVGLTAYSSLSLAQLMDREVAAVRKQIPTIAVPTTAGSGSEVTPFAVLTNPRTGLKQSLPSPYLYPDVAIVAPSLLKSTPRKVIGDTGMDALAHAFEALWSIQSNPVSDGIAFKAIQLIQGSFLRYYRNPEDPAAAAAMAMSATLAGKAFSNTFTAACHALSYPIGTEFGLSHGASCAMTLHLVADFNKVAVREKFEELSTYLGLDQSTEIPDFIKEIRSEIGTIPTFAELSATRAHLDRIAADAFRPLLNNNPVPLSHGEIIALLLPEIRS